LIGKTNPQQAGGDGHGGAREQNRTEQNRTLLPQAKYLWQAARIANMAIYAGCP